MTTGTSNSTGSVTMTLTVPYSLAPGTYVVRLTGPASRTGVTRIDYAVLTVTR